MDLPDQQLLDAAPDAMVVVDGSGIIVLVNQQTESLFGYSRDELLGQTVEKLIPRRFRHAHAEHRSGYVDAPRVRGMGDGRTLFGRRFNGEEFPVEISLSPIQTADGILVSSSIRDISAHIAAERALEEAREIAESATAAKSRFLAAASHDLRQPLQAISLYLSVLERQSEGPKAREIGGKMRVSLRVMGELLDALLDISKLDMGSVTPAPSDIRVQELIDRIVTANVQQASAKGLRLLTTGAHCVVHSDPVLLERIIENFVTNAIRYTEVGEIRIDCECLVSHARISVHDTGVGIAEEDLERVFEEYYQLDNPVRDRRKGLGLGLSIVKHIARLLDHPLDVRSTPGRGSTFSVDVPLGGPIEDRKEAVRISPAPVRRTQERVVLLVDDDPAIVDGTTILLESVGMKVHSALDGEGGLAHLAAGIYPDILISDFRLPGFNGVELLRRVRAASNRELPTVLMTGDTSTKEIDAAGLPNCTVLHKPVDTDVLISLIETLSG